MIEPPLVSLTPEDVRALPPIPSGFTTDRVFRLHRTVKEQGESWELCLQRLERPFVKVYDHGRVEEWLPSYAEVMPEGALRFFAAMGGHGDVAALLTWGHLRWNNTLWLMDIRVRRESRRTGYGLALVRHLQAEAETVGVRGISVETQINNYPALTFYQHLGFRLCGFNDHLYTNRDAERQDVAAFLFWETESTAGDSSG